VIELSIVIVSFNAKADLERCLASLHAAPPASTNEIIVVDNASTDGSTSVAATWPGVHVSVSPTNRGFSAANNVGIRASGGRNVLLLNSDTLVPPGAIDHLLGELDRHPDVAIVGPRLVDGSGRAELSFGSMITPLNEFRRRRLIRALERGDLQASALVEATTREEQFPDWVSGACLLVRRADADTVGLLDERFFMYTEDVDLCASVRERGRIVWFEPSAEVRHLRGRSASRNPETARLRIPLVSRPVGLSAASPCDERQ